MKLSEIVMALSGLASTTTIIGFVWRAISRFNRMEEKLDNLARQYRVSERRLTRVERVSHDH